MRSLNSLFIGRDDSLKTIEHAVLSSLEAKDASVPRRYVITGMGGQGKSELCLKIVNKLRSRFWGVFWVDVDTATTAESGFLDIAKRGGAFAETLEEARLALANLRHRWVLVLDNADNPHVDYQQYFPAGGFGTVFLTSRNSECSRYGTIGSYALEGLSPEHAQRLLCKAAEIPNEQMIELKDDAQHTASLLGYHPLALIQAGAYVARGHCTLSQYPSIYKDQRRRLLQFCSKQAQARYGHVYATFEASAQVLESSNQKAAKDALDMLSTMSMMSYNGLPLSIFEAAFQGARHAASTNAEKRDEIDHLSSWHVARLMPLMQPGSDAWDSFRMVEACHLLKSSSLISTEKDSDTTIIVIHPLTHAWARERQQESEQGGCWVSTGSMIASAWFGGKMQQTLERRLKPHLHSWLEKSPKDMFSYGPPMMIAQILYQCGMILHYIQDDNRLHKLLKKIFTAFALDDTNISDRWLPLYELRAMNLQKIGRAKQAVKIMEDIVKAKEKRLAEDHPDRLISQRALAEAYRANGLVREAVSLLKHVVKIQEKSLAEDHLVRLASQHALAGAYQANGQVREAMALLKHVVKIHGMSLAEDHPSRLASQQVLARVYRANGQVREAVMLLKHVVKIREKSLAEDHPDRLASQYALAGAYRANGQVGEAVALLKQVVKIREKSLAEDHPSRLISQHALAGVYHVNGQVGEAVVLLKHVLNIQEKSLAEDHLDRLASQHALAGAYQANGQVGEAVALLKHVVKIHGMSLAEDHPSRLASQHALAGVYRANGQVGEAVMLLKHVVKIQEKSLTVDHPNRLASQHALAVVYQVNGQVGEAMALLKHVVKIKEKDLTEDHPDRLASQHALAGAYQANGQVREAIALLTRVVKIQEKSLAEDHPDRLISQHALARAYQANGQVGEAVILLKHVVKIQENSLAENHPDRLASQHALAAATSTTSLIIGF